jgi:hypothetical protein
VGIGKANEKEFAGVTSSIQFFKQIGSSLPLRRAFQSWLSSKISEAYTDIKLFIDQAFTENISTLLSEYCAGFLLRLTSHCWKKKVLFKTNCFSSADSVQRSR